MATHEQGRQLLVIMAVIALHALFLLALLMRDTVRLIARELAPRDSVLFFIEDRPRPALKTPPTTLPQRPIRSSPPLKIIEPSASDSFPPTGSTEPPTNPSAIDWSTQAVQAAGAAVDRAIRQETRKCDPSDKPNSFLPPCKPRQHRFEWNPEERKVGFSGGLPYVRLGERCVVGLGFFGCSFGAKPPANGDLFEHMDDPERDRSSVPALADPHLQRQHVPSLPEPDSGGAEPAAQD